MEAQSSRSNADRAKQLGKGIRKRTNRRESDWGGQQKQDVEGSKGWTKDENGVEMWTRKWNERRLGKSLEKGTIAHEQGEEGSSPAVPSTVDPNVVDTGV